MKARIKELSKDVLLVLLSVNLVILTLAALPSESVRRSPLLSTLLQPLGFMLGLDQAELTYLEIREPVLDAAQPVTISVNTAAGRYSAQWDFTAVDSAFETLGGVLGQALDTAAAPVESTAAAFQEAMTGPSAYFAYDLCLPAEVLASWLDAVPEETLPQMRCCVLAADKETATLYFSDGEAVYRCQTALASQTLQGLLEQFRPDGSAFAFEAASPLSPLTLLPAENPALPAAQLSSPCDSRYAETLATNLGFNPYGDATYTDSAGVTYFTEAGCALQVAPTGEVLLTTTTDERFRAADDTPAALVEEARRLVSLAAGDYAGDARLYLSRLTENEDGNTVCTFYYYLSGVPVALTGGQGAEVVFDGQAVRSMTVQAVTFETTGATLAVIPLAQAAAVLRPGDTLALQYRVQEGALVAGWLN